MVALGMVDRVLTENPPMGVRRQYVAGLQHDIAGLQTARQPSARVGAGLCRKRQHGK